MALLNGHHQKLIFRMLLSLGGQVEIESTYNSMAPILLNPPNQLPSNQM